MPLAPHSSSAEFFLCLVFQDWRGHMCFKAFSWILARPPVLSKVQCKITYNILWRYRTWICTWSLGICKYNGPISMISTIIVYESRSIEPVSWKTWQSRPGRHFGNTTKHMVWEVHCPWMFLQAISFWWVLCFLWAPERGGGCSGSNEMAALKGSNLILATHFLRTVDIWLMVSV
jgi:hypothetical protein